MVRMTARDLIGWWSRLSGHRKAMLIEAFAAVSIASAAVSLLRFRQAVRLGCRRLAAPIGRGEIAAGDVAWAVRAVGRTVPWRALCLQQGLAAQWMLRRRGVDAQLHYGIGKKQTGDLEAHVWVSVRDRIICGGEEAARFQLMASFPAATSP